MTFNKDRAIKLLITIFISLFICTISSLLFFDELVSVYSLLNSVLIGSIIWAFAEILFTFVSKVWPHSIFPSYVALFVLIAFGTTLGLIILSVTSAWIILAICALAELGGMSITIISRNNYKQTLNKQLDKYKKNNP